VRYEASTLWLPCFQSRKPIKRGDLLGSRKGITVLQLLPSWTTKPYLYSYDSCKVGTKSVCSRTMRGIMTWPAQDW